MHKTAQELRAIAADLRKCAALSAAPVKKREVKHVDLQKLAAFVRFFGVRHE